MDIKMIKGDAKTAFKANYWRCVLVAFIMGLLTTGATTASGKNTYTNSRETGENILNTFNSLSPHEQTVAAGIVFGTVAVILVISILLEIFVFNPLKVGGYRFFKKNIDDENTEVGTLKEGFGNYGHTFGTMFLKDLFLALWTMLFLIPGIIKGYSYMLVPYIIKDNPDLSATEVITRSRELMNGHKGEAFLMDLSFIGWYIVGALTLNLGNIFWTVPYHQSARARFYLELLPERNEF